MDYSVSNVFKGLHLQIDELLSQFNNPKLTNSQSPNTICPLSSTCRGPGCSTNRLNKAAHAPFSPMIHPPALSFLSIPRHSQARWDQSFLQCILDCFTVRWNQNTSTRRHHYRMTGPSDRTFHMKQQWCYSFVWAFQPPSSSYMFYTWFQINSS